MGESITPLPHAPATARNREPILDVLGRVLPASGTVLESASGTGEHAAFFASRLPALAWCPSDADPANVIAMGHRVSQVALDNLRPPIRLDASESCWPVDRADAVFCANMIHIAPWGATVGLIAGAARILPAGGRLCLYGPFRTLRHPIAPSNVAFDAWLRERNSAWGVRDLEVICDLAGSRALNLIETVEMPANNLMPLFEKTP